MDKSLPRASSKNALSIRDRTRQQRHSETTPGDDSSFLDVEHRYSDHPFYGIPENESSIVCASDFNLMLLSLFIGFLITKK